MPCLCVSPTARKKNERREISLNLLISIFFLPPLAALKWNLILWPCVLSGAMLRRATFSFLSSRQFKLLLWKLAWVCYFFFSSSVKFCWYKLVPISFLCAFIVPFEVKHSSASCATPIEPIQPPSLLHTPTRHVEIQYFPALFNYLQKYLNISAQIINLFFLLCWGLEREREFN